MTNLTPIDDRIIIKKIEVDDTTSGGIILPDVSKETPQFAVVVSIGPGKKDDKGNTTPIDYLNVGDKVLFARYSGTEVRINGEDLLILRANEILAKVI